MKKTNAASKAFSTALVTLPESKLAPSRHPLRLIIHVPLREKRDFRLSLVGLKNALCISQVGEVTTYDLLPTLKPRKGQEYRLVLCLAEQLQQGWTLAVWDVESLLRDLAGVLSSVSIGRPSMKAAVDEAWRLILDADVDRIVDLRLFEKLPNGHYVALVAAGENFDYDTMPPRLRRRAMAQDRPIRPVCEDFWGVLAPLVLKRPDAERAWSSYRRWVKNNRPRPPRADTP